MKFLARISYQLHLHDRLHLLIDSDTASWLLVYLVSAVSVCVSFLILSTPDYFPI